jgi:hypothetical protein
VIETTLPWTRAPTGYRAGDVLPRVRLELLEAERDALALPVDVEDLDLDLLADLDHLRRVRDAAPRHVGDVQQAVHAAEVDERAEVGDVLDDALPDLVDLRELLHQLLALPARSPLEDHAARHDDVAAPLVQLDDLELVGLAEQLVDVRHAAERDLRPGQERVDAHQVDHHAALDLLDERALHRLVVLVRDADLLPHAHEVGLLLGQDDRAFLSSRFSRNTSISSPAVSVGLLELFERNGPLGLEADVEDDVGVGHAEHAGLDDLALDDALERALVQGEHLLVLLRGVLLVVEVGADDDAGGRGLLAGFGGLLSHENGLPGMAGARGGRPVRVRALPTAGCAKLVSVDRPSVYVKVGERFPCQLRDDVHLVFQGQVGRVEGDRVVRPLERGHASGRVRMVPRLEAGRLGHQGLGRDLPTFLQETAARSFFGGGGQKHLEPGVREDHGPDVPAVRDDAAGVEGRGLPQQAVDHVPDRGQGGDRRDLSGHVRPAHHVRDVGAGDLREEPVRAQDETDGPVRRQRGDPLPVERQVRVDGGKRERAVERTAVQVRETQPGRDGPGGGRLARPGGPVDGDDVSVHVP